MSKRGQAYRTDCWGCGYRREGLAGDAPCPECGLTHEEAREFIRERSQGRLYRTCVGLLFTAWPFALFITLGWVLANAALGIPRGSVVLTGTHPLLDVIGFCVKPMILLALVSPIGLLVLPFEAGLLIRLGRRYARPWRSRVLVLLIAAIPALGFVSLLVPGNPLRGLFDWLPV